MLLFKVQIIKIKKNKAFIMIMSKIKKDKVNLYLFDTDERRMLNENGDCGCILHHKQIRKLMKGE